MILRLVRDRSGAAATIAALSLPVVIGGTGFAVDASRMVSAKTQLQAAADAAAAAAATKIGSGATAASSTGKAVALANMPAGAPDKAVVVEVGTWNATTSTFTPGTGANALTTRVTTKMTEAAGNAFEPLFGKFVGVDKVDLTATSIASADCIVVAGYRLPFPPTTQFRLVTLGNWDGKGTSYLQNAGRHPWVRVDNPTHGPATVVFNIAGRGTFTFRLPGHGQFIMPVTSIVNNSAPGQLSLTFSLNTAPPAPGGRWGGTSVWVNNIRNAPDLPLEKVCAAGSPARSRLVG